MMNKIKMKVIVDRVEAAGGLAPCTLGELREIANRGRLGPGVLEEVTRQLDGYGMEFYPYPDEPLRQSDEVRVIKRSSPVGQLVLSVLRPSTNGDARLLEAAEGANAEIVSQIRTLVCR